MIHAAAVFSCLCGGPPIHASPIKLIRMVAMCLVVTALGGAVASSVRGADPENDSGGTDATGASDVDKALELAFVQTSFDEARSGYVTLEWNRVEGAVEYEVTDQEQSRLYRGVHERGFVSGLTDGDYQFRVLARDQNGNVIAQSTVPAELTVRHWPLAYAFVLFGCGLVVFTVIVGVIVRGALASRRESSESPSHASASVPTVGTES